MDSRRRWSCSGCWPPALPDISFGAKRKPEKADNIPVAPELSVVIPIRNEAPSIVELHRELTETLTTWGHSYELVIVDDGSTDESFSLLARLQALDPCLRVIRFRRNFGQTAAFAAGFDH